MALQSTALVNEWELRKHLGTDPADDYLLAELINAITNAVESWCRNGFVNRTYTEDYSGGRKAWKLGGVKILRLRRYPINSVTSITDDDSNTVAAADYTVVADHGWLEHDGTWPVPSGRWTIVYNAGRYADTDAVDPALKLAAKLWAEAVWSSGPPGVKSEKVEEASITYVTDEGDGGALADPPERVKVMLAPFVSREV